MPAKKKPKKKVVRHLKTKDAELSIQFRGKTVLISILLRGTLAKHLAYRLASPERFLDSVKKRLND
jgi:hypothetical protein